MSEYACVCGEGMPQLRRDKCPDFIKNMAAIMPMQLNAADGSANFINLDPLPVAESVFTSLFNATDSTKRLHWIGDVQNWTPTMGEPILQTWDNGTTTKLQNGQLSASLVVPSTSPLVQYALGALECVNPGVYLMDVANTIVGYANPDAIETDKKLYPIPVQKWQVDSNPFGSATSVAMSTVTIFFPVNLKFDHLIMLNASQHDLSGVKNHEAGEAILTMPTAPTTTTVVVKATQPSSGILGSNAPISGLGISSFSLVEAPSTAITPTTVVESPAGTYTFTVSGLASADVVRASLTSTSGYISNTASGTVA